MSRIIFQYKSVPIGSADALQRLLDQHALDGWRLVQTFQSMGYTVSLIFERELDA